MELPPIWQGYPSQCQGFPASTPLDSYAARLHGTAGLGRCLSWSGTRRLPGGADLGQGKCAGMFFREHQAFPPIFDGGSNGR